MYINLLNKDSKTHEKITELDKILNDFKDFDYKELGLKSTYNCNIFTIIFCSKCFVDHGKFIKNNSIKKMVYHLVSFTHQDDSSKYPTTNQVKRIIELYSIKLQVEESQKNILTKKQEKQLIKIYSIMSDLGMIVRGNK